MTWGATKSLSERSPSAVLLATRASTKAAAPGPPAALGPTASTVSATEAASAASSPMHSA